MRPKLETKIKILKVLVISLGCNLCYTEKEGAEQYKQATCSYSGVRLQQIKHIGVLTLVMP